MCKNVDLFDVIVNNHINNKSSNNNNNIGTETGVSDENFPDDKSSKPLTLSSPNEYRLISVN